MELLATVKQFIEDWLDLPWREGLVEILGCAMVFVLFIMITIFAMAIC